MSLAIVIPSRNVENLVPCIQAIHQYDPGHRTIIVDDGLLLDPWPEWLDGTEIVKGVQPFIFSRAVNSGILRAIELEPELSGILTTNDDALLQTPGGFSLLARTAEEHPEFGIIGAVTNVTGQPLQRPQGIGLREVEHFAFVCVYIPRRTIDQIGLLDERYCLDYGVEDRDYCESCWRSGLKVGVYDFCFVDHGSLTSSFRGEPTAPRSFQRNLGLFNQKWGYI